MTKPPVFASEDPRRLRELLARSCELAELHTLASVVVGLAALEGDVLIPEVIDFVESALRVEDAVFRMTRERAVLFLTDVDRGEAERILTRILSEFRDRFPTITGPHVQLGFYEVGPLTRGVGLKEVLPSLFRERDRAGHSTATH